MTHLEVGTEFTCLHERQKSHHFQSASKPQKVYGDDECWQSAKCSEEPDVQDTAQLKGSSVGKDLGSPIFSGELAKGYFNIDLRAGIRQISELGINVISQDLQNVPLNNSATVPFEHCVPGKVICTTKNGVVNFIRQLELSQTPCTQGCILEKDLSVHDGQYTEGEHFQRVDSDRFSGSFGTGFRCVDNGKSFFLKQTSLKKFHPNEVLIPIQLDHENVTKLYGVIQRDDMVEIFMEDAGVSLTDFVRSKPRLNEVLIWSLMKQGLAGLKELHENNMIHHDIKSDNLCVCTNPNGSLTLKVTDFGSARTIDEPVDSMAWTPAYLAPEACRQVLQQFKQYQNFFEKLPVGNRNLQITGKVDVFALGITGLFMFQKRHVLLHEITHGQISYNDLPAKEKQKLDFQLLQYLAVMNEPAQHLVPKDCSKEMQYLLSRMLSGSPDQRFSAGEALAYIERVEQMMSQLEQILKECQQTQKGRLITHPTENTQDADEMKAIYGGVKDLTKEKLRKKTLKNIKEREDNERGTDVPILTETMRQKPVDNPAQPPLTILSRKMETDVETRRVSATIQHLDRTAGAVNQWTKALLHALQVSTKQREPSVLNGVCPNPVTQNSIPQHIIHWTGMSQSGKPEKRKHEAELNHLPGKKMRQSMSGDSTTDGPALPAPAIPNSVRTGLSKSNMMDEMKPTMVDDTQPMHEDMTKYIEKDSAMQDSAGNIPNFSKLF